jgi:hypothetical protein
MAPAARRIVLVGSAQLATTAICASARMCSATARSPPGFALGGTVLCDAVECDAEASVVGDSRGRLLHRVAR